MKRLRFGVRRLPPSLVAGAVVVTAVVIVALISMFWTPRDPTQVSVIHRLRQPGQDGYPLGSDQLGRDVLSGIMAGARNTLLVGILTVIVAMGVGVPLGGLAALRPGWLGSLVLRVSDILLGFPALLLAILFAAVFHPSTLTAVFAIGISFVPVFVRVVRGSGLQILEQDYVTAARTFGSSGSRVFWKHLLPNVGPVIIVQATLAFAIAILAEAALSYLGLGTPPPTPSWGRMLSESQNYLNQSPLLALWPGLSIVLSVLGFTLAGDGLRDLLDPKLTERLSPQQ